MLSCTDCSDAQAKVSPETGEPPQAPAVFCLVQNSLVSQLD